MASRDHLKKIKKTMLLKMCEDIGVDVKGKKKEELVDLLFTNGVPALHITPVVDQNSVFTGVLPKIDDQDMDDALPPFNKCNYTSVPYSELPSPTFLAIYNFMVARSRASCPDRGVQNFKGVDRAVRHFEAGDVQDIQISQINGSVIYIRASCLASMKKDRYTVYLCLTQNNQETSVQYAYCQCPIGLAQACSHIGGVLFALNGKHRLQCGNTEDSCTSQLCQWIIPRDHKQTPKPVSELSFVRPDLDSESRKETSINFDPRHPQDRIIDLTNTLDQLKELKKLFPNTCLTHLWHIPDDVPEVAEEVSIDFKVDPRKEEMEKMVFRHGNVPPLTIDNDLVQFIEFSTREQRLCPIWHDLHRGRITSSIFGQVLKAGSSPTSLINHIIDGSNLQSKYSSLPPAVKYGQDHEIDAKRDYISIKSISEHVVVEDTGLTLCASHSFLGATSDGRVHEAGEVGVLEIKCPFSLKGKPVNKMEIQDIVSLSDPAFYLEQRNYWPQLRRDHHYYTQVQGEMAIMGLPWCDFVVWTGAKNGNIFIERIIFDKDFVTAMMPKLVDFYCVNVVPKLVL